MSYIHFTSTEQIEQHIIQRGEDPLRFFTSGTPRIDNITNLKLLSKIELKDDLH